MKIKLKSFAEDSNSAGRQYRFAVINTEKSCDYPSNFVCLLPTIINNDKKTQNLFSKIFGVKSQEQAELLLNRTLRNESESVVRDEIRRRLALIAPKKYLRMRCLGCDKVFYQGRSKKVKAGLCEGCFGSRV